MVKVKWIFRLSLFLTVLVSVAKCEETKGFNFIKAALACEGITDSSKILEYQNQYKTLYQSLLKKIDREDDIYDQNEDLFKFLHKSYLLKYDESSKMSIIFDKQFYNCVTASVLYYSICQDLGFNTKIYSTPYHVFLKVFEKDKPIRVDLTDPIDGFDYKENRNKIIERLLLSKMITLEELNRRGVDSIYNDFVIETIEINENNLLQVVESNLALEDNEDEKYDSAYLKIFEALKVDPKFKDVQRNYIYIWSNSIQKYGKASNLEKIDTLVNDALQFPEFSDDFKKSILSIAGDLINDYIHDIKPFSNVDTIYARCERAMGKEKYFNSEMATAKVNLELYRAFDLLKKGFYEEACNVAEKLYTQSNKMEGRTQDAYIRFTQTYVEYLLQNDEYEEAIKRADSLFKQIPDFPVVQEFFISTIMTSMGNGYFDKDLGKAEKLISSAASVNPGNIKTKKIMGSLYYQYSMAMVRKKEYKTAMKYAQDGLKYDENSSNLHSAIDLIKPLIK